VNEDGILLEEDKQLALWLDNWSEADSMALILQHMEVAFFSDIAREIKEAAQRAAMAVCLGGLTIGKAIVSIGGAIVSGIANYLTSTRSSDQGHGSQVL